MPVTFQPSPITKPSGMARILEVSRNECSLLGSQRSDGFPKVLGVSKDSLSSHVFLGKLRVGCSL